jgi:Uma2 family endonuclease
MVMVTRAQSRTVRSAPPKEPRIRPWTRADLARLPDDGNRYEVLDGALLVTPQASLAHQRVALRLAMAIETYVANYGVAHVVGPGAVPFGKNELQPDIQVIPGHPRLGNWADAPAPILVVEVLSRSTERRDLGIKLDAYMDRVHVPTVWIVDQKQREVHICVRGAPPRIERQSLEWQAPDAPEPLRIDLPAFFVSALGA